MEPTTVTCSSACTVTHVLTLEGSTALSPEKVQDYMELTGLYLVAAVVVLCAKALYNRFRIDYDH